MWQRYFPYNLRPYQKEVIEGIEDSKSKFILLQAPTGFGKTICVLSSVLGKGKRIFWVVRTGNQTDRPIEELMEIYKKGYNFIGISLRGKKDMCLMAKKFNARDNESVQELCKRWKKNCIYYKRLLNFEFLPNKPMRFSDIKEICKENKVCPYYLQIEIVPEADLISLNYNYIFTPLSKMFLRFFSNSILVVDEAHNIYDYIIKSYSDRITENTVERAFNELKKVGHNGILLKKLADLSYELKRLSERERVLDKEFFEDRGIGEEEAEILREYADKYLDYLIKIRKTPRSSLNHLQRFLRTFFENAGKPGKYLFLYRERDRWVLEYRDFDIREKLEEIWRRFDRIILMSGTLEPIDVFVNLLGIQNYTYIKVPHFVREENVLTLFLNDVTTKGESVEERFVDRYKIALEQFLKANFNVGIYFPSYNVLEIFKEFIKDTCKELEKEVYFEREDMPGDEALKIMEKLRERNSVLVGIAGGRFSEGVDFPGEIMEGIFIVGIPFERPNLILRKKLEFLRKVYGKRARYIGYVVPAIKKVSQTIGRILRSREDRGFIVLGDYRLIRNRIYFNLLPDFVKKTAHVDRSGNLEKYLDLFMSGKGI